MKFNFHTHSRYSDGKNTIEELVEVAISQKFDILGISDHGYVPFPSKWNTAEIVIDKYFSEIDQIQKKYQDKIQLLKGIEADYVENICDLKPYRNYNFDYIIGSVHYFPYQFDNGKYFNFDTTEQEFIKGLERFFDNNIEKMVNRYYDNILQMLETTPPDIVGHLDIIAKFNKDNKFFDENATWYTKLIDKVLLTIQKNNVIVEVNARRKYRNFHNDVSPATPILLKMQNLQIPITISGDIHYKEELTMYWDETLRLVKDLGFKELTYLNQKQWNTLKI